LSISIVVERVILPFTGKLVDLLAENDKNIVPVELSTGPGNQPPPRSESRQGCPGKIRTRITDLHNLEPLASDLP
jgi:hypothetical protein